MRNIILIGTFSINSMLLFYAAHSIMITGHEVLISFVYDMCRYTCICVEGRGTRHLYIGLGLHLHVCSCHIYASSESSGETVRMCRIVWVLTYRIFN